MEIIKTHTYVLKGINELRQNIDNNRLCVWHTLVVRDCKWIIQSMQDWKIFYQMFQNLNLYSLGREKDKNSNTRSCSRLWMDGRVWNIPDSWAKFREYGSIAGSRWSNQWSESGEEMGSRDNVISSVPVSVRLQWSPSNAMESMGSRH